MLHKEIKYSYNDVMIQPSVYSNIRHRSECNPYLEDGNLPIFTAPMSNVVNEKNYDIFAKNHIIPILPRNIDVRTRFDYAITGKWAAFSLSEFEHLFCDKKITHNTAPCKALIDVANGHMSCIYELVKKAKEIHGKENIIVMVGNIATPETYRVAYDAGVDYLRCSIGTGNVCLSSSNLGIHYPIASLLDEIYKIKKDIEFEAKYHGRTLPKIVADGGVRGYCDITKAISLGADYVMCGSIFAQLVESAAKTFTYDRNDNLVGFDPLGEDTIREQDGYFLVNDEHLTDKIYKRYYGMASRQGQIDINGEKTKTSEGTEKTLPVTTNIDKWVDNMQSYMRSAMSYCNITDITEFNPDNVDVYVISENTKNSINK